MININIRIGSYVTIGDGSTFCTWYSTPTGVPASIYVGNHTIIEPGCCINSCIIDEKVKIGSRSVISEGCIIGKGAIIAPNSFVSPGSYIPPGTLWAGSPVKLVRQLNENEQNSVYIESYNNWEKNKEVKEDDHIVAQRNEEVANYLESNYFTWRSKYDV